MNESKVLALPKKAGQKYSVFSGNQIHTFDFEFKIPDNNNLPSSVKVMKKKKSTIKRWCNPLHAIDTKSSGYKLYINSCS